MTEKQIQKLRDMYPKGDKYFVIYYKHYSPSNLPKIIEVYTYASWYHPKSDTFSISLDADEYNETFNINKDGTINHEESEDKFYKTKEEAYPDFEKLIKSEIKFHEAQVRNLEKLI